MKLIGDVGKIIYFLNHITGTISTLNIGFEKFYNLKYFAKNIYIYIIVKLYDLIIIK